MLLIRGRCRDLIRWNLQGGGEAMEAEVGDLAKRRKRTIRKESGHAVAAVHTILYIVVDHAVVPL